MTDTPETDLLACPFCGAAPDGPLDADNTKCLFDHGGDIWHSVECGWCYARGPRRETVPEAIEAWADVALRAQLAQVTAERDVAVAAISDGLDILSNLRTNIQKHGHYTVESTGTFLGQALSAMEEALRALASTDKGGQSDG